MKYNIVVLSGDGIGPEVTTQAEKILFEASKKYGFDVYISHALIGGAAIDKLDTPLPDETVKACINCDAVLLGAVGGYKWDNLSGDKRPEKGLLGIRKAMNLYANLRPARIFSQLKDSSPLKENIISNGLDVLIVRELTGGIYFGERGRDEFGAYDTERYSIAEIERVARVAFNAAQKRNNKVCLVDKANVLESSRLWREVVSSVAKDYPSVTLSYMFVDNAAMQLVRNPMQFDVILTNNIFGDILSDEASMISGSIGMLPSASLGSSSLGLYEAIHGSAPDIAGKDIANPLGTILSLAMLMRYSLKREDVAKSIENAVQNALNIARTADIASDKLPIVGTIKMGDIVASLLK